MISVLLALLSQTCPPRDVWPSPDWAVRTTTRAEARDALDAYAFTTTGADEDRIGVRTEGIVVIHRGVIIHERYARDFDAAKRHLAWSVSKSFVNALVGRAVREGHLAASDSICKHLGGDVACDVTLLNLLELASGFAWKEVYENQSNQESSVLAMLYGQGHEDMAEFVRGHAFRDVPGTAFAYSTGDTTLLAAAVGRAVERKLGADWAWPLLFDPLGITSAVWERDRKGVYVGGSYLYATPRDFARLGYLFMNDGCWKGARLLPEGWVRDSTQLSAPFTAMAREIEPGDAQGRQWWLNLPAHGNDAPWSAAPADTYAALGHWGQSITVIPSRDLIVVRTADDRDEAFDMNRFLELALEVAR